MNLSDAVADYCGSEHFLFLNDSLKGSAEQLLAQWSSEMGVATDFEALQDSVRKIAQLDLPLNLKREFPELLGAFFEYLETSKGHPEAERWSEYLTEIGEAYAADLRDDGSLKGATVTKALKIGRNNPCPCGSGKKFKKCCGK